MGDKNSIMGQYQSPLLGLEQVASLSAAAHDLKTPLSTVHYLASSLLDPDLSLTEIERKDYLWRIQLSMQRGLHLIEGLTYAYNTAQLELDLEPVNVMHVCEDVLHELHPLTRQMAQTIELKAPRSSALALAHHTVLRSVLTNLCDNALKHNPPESHVMVRVACSDERISIGVRDNGPRISLSDYRRLKQRLGKEVNPLGKRVGSSGLGLYVASQLAEAMQGELDLMRHQQTGLTWRLSLQPSRQLSFI